MIILETVLDKMITGETFTTSIIIFVLFVLLGIFLKSLSKSK